MNLDDPILLALTQVLVLAVPAAGLALLLRLSGAPGGARGAAVAAGFIMGILAGPGVLGTARPELHDPIFLGGVEQAQTLHDKQREHQRELLALTGAGVSEIAIEENRARHRGELLPLTDALSEARRAHREKLEVLSKSVISLVMLGLVMSAAPRLRRSSYASIRRTLMQTKFAPLLAGTVAFALALAAPGAAWSLVADDSPSQVIAFALLMGAPALSAALPGLLWIMCAVATFVALLISGAIAPHFGSLALASALVMSIGASQMLPRQLARRLRRASRDIAHWVLLPLAASFLAVRIDLRELAADPVTRWAFWWGLGIAILWSSDGRMFAWFAALRVCKLTGLRQSQWTDSARCVNAGADVMTIALALVFLGSGAASDTAISSAMFGAALVTITPGMRLFVAKWLDQPPAPSPSGRGPG